MVQNAGYDFKTPVQLTTQNGKYVSDTDISNAAAGMLNQIGVKATVEIVEGGVFQQMTTSQKWGPLHVNGWYSHGGASFPAVWYTEGRVRAEWRRPHAEQRVVCGPPT